MIGLGFLSMVNWKRLAPLLKYDTVISIISNQLKIQLFQKFCSWDDSFLVFCNVIQLKARYGQAYKIVITTPTKYEEKARKYLFKLIPTAKVINTLAGTTKYEVSDISFEWSPNWVLLFVLYWQFQSLRHRSQMFGCGKYSQPLNSREKSYTSSIGAFLTQVPCH